MNTPGIIIYPKSTSSQPESTPEIIQAIGNIGLISNAFGKAQFYAGDSFLSLVSFLGCSPNINLSPKEEENFCYIKINNTTGDAILLGHTDSVIPRCPNCKHKHKNWQSISNYTLANTRINCPECDMKSTMSDLKWRQEAGYGNFYIAITNIHSHEAVPSEKLLLTLEQTTDFAWHYFYANNL